MSETKDDGTSGRLKWRTVKEISVLLVMAVAAFKIATSDFSVVLSNFSFSDLLALILALFSVGLSAAFYFKSAESSNRFYTNSHSFTKDVSEILGRIEAGFGERLRNLDQGYTGLVEKFERYPPHFAAEQAAKEENKADSAQEQQQQLLEELAKRAKLQDSEKNELFEKLRALSTELAEARKQAEIYRTMLDQSTSHSASDSGVISYLIHKIERHVDRDWWSKQSSPRELFARVRPHLIERALVDMKNEGFLADDGSLTDKAETELARARLRRQFR